MKKLLGALLILFLLSSCNLNSSKKVGILLPDLRKERWQKDELFLKQRLSELNLEAAVHDAAGSAEVQYSQAKELINSGVGVIIIVSVNANISAAIVRDAHKKGIKVIAYDRLIKNADLDYYVSHNNIQVGELIAKYEVRLKPKGNYMLLLGDRADNNAIFVKEGIMKVLQPLVNSGSIRIVYQAFMERWRGSEAYFHVGRYLDFSNEEVDVILACGDGMAQGVIKALEENNLLGEVNVTGQNADLVAIKSILKGEQSMTVYKPLKELAIAAADLANELLNGKTPTGINSSINNSKIDVPSILIPVQTVDKNNIDEVLINSGFYTKEQIYSE